MTMSCETMTDHMPDLASGVIDARDPGEAARMRAHIAECTDCAAEWSLISALRAPIAVPAGMHARIADELARRPVVYATSEDAREGAVSRIDASVDGARRRTWGVRQLTIAATITVALIGGGIAVQQMQRDEGIAPVIVADSAAPQTDVAASEGAAATAVPASVAPAVQDPVLGGRSVLPEMTEAQLEALLSKMGS